MIWHIFFLNAGLHKEQRKLSVSATWLRIVTLVFTRCHVRVTLLNRAFSITSACTMRFLTVPLVCACFWGAVDSCLIHTGLEQLLNAQIINLKHLGGIEKTW